MPRQVRMLPLDTAFFDRINADITKVVGVVMSGVHVNNLLKIISAMINQGWLPPDAKMEWLYFDTRLNNWAVLIWSATYRELAFDEMAPLLEF